MMQRALVQGSVVVVVGGRVAVVEVVVPGTMVVVVGGA